MEITKSPSTAIHRITTITFGPFLRPSNLQTKVHSSNFHFSTTYAAHRSRFVYRNPSTLSPVPDIFHNLRREGTVCFSSRGNRAFLLGFEINCYIIIDNQYRVNGGKDSRVTNSGKNFLGSSPISRVCGLGASTSAASVPSLR